MNMYKKFLVGVLLLASIGAQRLHAMETESETILQDLKTQMMLSVFIVMRVNFAGDHDEKHWAQVPLGSNDCCREFSIPNEENKRKHQVSITLDPEKPCPLNEGWTDLHFTRRLLGHLDFLYDPGIIELIEISDYARREVAKTAYEMFCTLSSLYSTKFNGIQKNFIKRLSGTYLIKESFDGLDISIEDISLLLDISKTLLLKLLDLSFLRTYPCDYEDENMPSYCIGYLKREEFCRHYISAHCSNLELDVVGDLLGWFRIESLSLSSEQVYDYFKNLMNG